MARCALFLTDLFGASGVTIFDHSGYNTALPVSNVSHPLPGKVFEQLEGQHLSGNAGMFEVSSKTGLNVYINEGAGAVTTLITAGTYDANTLAARIQTDLRANGSLPNAATYFVSYNSTSRLFTVSNTGTAFILVNVNSDNVLTSECGFDASNTASLASHKSDDERSSTITRVIFDAGAGNVIDPDLVWTMLNSTGGTDADAATIYNDVTVYAHATYLGQQWAQWDGVASETFSISDRPAETENTVQGAVTSTDTGYRYWAFFWRHVDDHTSHQIGVLRAAAALTSAVHTVREVNSHHLANRTAPRTLENQHPVNLLSDWRMTIELERWTASEFRAFKVEADRYGAADGMLFSLLWTDIVAGSLTVNAQADKGQLFYGSIVGSSTDSYAGNESDYMSGSLDLAQLRGP
jgi:hypothetical protein